MKANIPTQIIPVTKEQTYLTQVPELYPIPTNAIIDKTLTGIGATYAEITYKQRNSIIIMPNISVIKSKHGHHKKLDDTLAVWHETPKYVISEYLDKRMYPKKLLITPEAFERVKLILESKGVNIYTEYFLLIDESHKSIKDVDYRDKIVYPMKYFFDFEGKAFITATHLVPSDPRFKNHNFKLLKVKPLYKYDVKLHLVHVNDTTKAVKNYISEHSPEHYCIFLNSIKAIQRLISLLQLQDDCNIYCSVESVNELKKQGYSSVFSEVSPLAKYNFFTSSFYNGLDIEVASKPDILIITDMSIPFTAVDPYTDVQQIIGRFRNQSFNKVTHLFTDDFKIKTKTEEQVYRSLEVQKQVYEAVQALQKATPDIHKDEYLANLFSQEIQRQAYSTFVLDGETNYFKIDNFINRQRVLSYYQSAENLLAAYSDNSKCFDITFNQAFLIAKKSEHLKVRSGKRYSIENIRKIAITLHKLDQYKDSDEYKDAHKHYTKHALEIVQAFKKLGYHEIEKLGFKRSAIKKAVIMFDYLSKRNSFPIIDRMHQEFKIGFPIPCTTISKKISSIYNEYQIVKERITASEIEFFFDCKLTTRKLNGKSVKAYILFAPKQNQHLDYIRN